jgi:hypothetical protein
MYSPSWSPEGTKITFYVSNRDGNSPEDYSSDIYVMLNLWRPPVICKRETVWLSGSEDIAARFLAPAYGQEVGGWKREQQAPQRYRYGGCTTARRKT